VALVFVIFQLRRERDEIQIGLSATYEQLDGAVADQAELTELTEKLKDEKARLRIADEQLRRANRQIERLQREQLRANCLVEIARRCRQLVDRLEGEVDQAVAARLSITARLLNYLVPESSDALVHLTGVLDEAAKELAQITSVLDDLVREYFPKNPSKFYALLDVNIHDESEQEQYVQTTPDLGGNPEAERQNLELRRRNKMLEEENSRLKKDKLRAAMEARANKRSGNYTSASRSVVFATLAGY
jgi:hypothetical protein